MRKVFLENLPKWEKGEGAGNIGTVNWGKCVGYKVRFTYDDIEGCLEIVKYDKNNRKIFVMYNGEQYDVNSADLKKGAIGKVVKKRTGDFKVEIGVPFKSDNRDLIVTDREYRYRNKSNGQIERQKFYKYTCNKCGWTEGWIEESNLRKGNGCACCCPTPRIIVPEINSIWATDRWMCNLGVSEEDAKKYTKSGSDEIEIICPHCGTKKKKRINDIHNKKSIGCTCGDGFSYPSKFVFDLLKQVNVDFYIEYNPEWIKPKRYDFYIPEYNMIIEVHGSQHYKETGRKEARNLIEEQENDRIKRELALANGIKYYIELDCRESNLEWIKNSILNSKLNVSFDLSNINWLKCEEFAINSNKVKEVCDYWNNKEEWETTYTIVENNKWGIKGVSTIKKYLKAGTKLGWCDYNPEDEKMKSSKKKNKIGKQVEIFKNNKSLGIFESCAELARQSEELFGVKLFKDAIHPVCNGRRKEYKGFEFRYL